MISIAATDLAKYRIPLAANTVVDVELLGEASSVDLVAAGTTDIWYTTDGTNPTVAGPNCYWLPAGVMTADTRQTRAVVPSARLLIRLLAEGDTKVSIIRGKA